MELSVVVPTLNGRDRLARCLDSLAERVADAEVIVVNGPSADGTTGMVRERDDVEVLLEVSDRNINVARNAGLREANGDVIAMLDDGFCVEPGWYDAIEETTARVDVVTGPADRGLDGGSPTGPDIERVAGRPVTHFDGGNVAFTRSAIEGIDGFDEYLQVGGADDAAHRLAGRRSTVEWNPEMAVCRGVGTDGGATPPGAPRTHVRSDEFGRGRTCRSLTYRLVKNYGPRPAMIPAFAGALGRTQRSGTTHGPGATHGSGAGRGRVDERGPDGDRTDGTGDGRSPLQWLRGCRSAVCNGLVGTRDGFLARVRDRSDRHNPNGTTARADRVVERYDWR